MIKYLILCFKKTNKQTKSKPFLFYKIKQQASNKPKPNCLNIKLIKKLNN